MARVQCGQECTVRCVCSADILALHCHLGSLSCQPKLVTQTRPNPLRAFDGCLCWMHQNGPRSSAEEPSQCYITGVLKMLPFGLAVAALACFYTFMSRDTSAVRAVTSKMQYVLILLCLPILVVASWLRGPVRQLPWQQPHLI